MNDENKMDPVGFQSGAKLAVPQLPSKYSISEDVAEESLQKLFTLYDIEPNDIEDNDQRNNVLTAKRKVLRAIREKLVVITERDGELIVIQNLTKPPGEVTQIEYGEISGKAKVALKNKKADDGYGRIYSIMGSLSGLGETAITNLKVRDMGIAESLGMLFLQA